MLDLQRIRIAVFFFRNLRFLKPAPDLLSVRFDIH